MRVAMPTTRRAKALALLAILLLSGLAPVVLSGPQETIDTIFGGLEDRRTRVEEALGKALEALDPVQRNLDDALAAIDGLEESAQDEYLLASYFLDQNFDQGPEYGNGESARRLGGWGDWLGAGSPGWRPDPRAPKIGDQGFGFWDGNLETQRYPIGTQPLDAYFVSPRISLEALPVSNMEAANAPDGVLAGVQSGAANQQTALGNYERAYCGPNGLDCSAVVGAAGAAGDILASQGLATGTGDKHRILLHLNHRFNFATNPGEDGPTGVDGGRIEAISCTLASCRTPTAEDLAAFRAGLPIGGGLVGTVLVPLSSDTDQTTPTTAFADDAAGEGLAFTGANQADGDSLSRFDLTSLAGRDVWLAFHAGTTAKGQSAKAYFNTKTNSHFDLDKGFFGWTLNQVHIDGPAWEHNVRIDEILEPAFRIDAANRKAAAGQNEFSALLINRGGSEETITPTLLVTDRQTGDTSYCLADPDTLVMRAGDAVRVRFSDCDLPDGSRGPLQLTDGHLHDVAFLAPLDTDLFTADNRVDLVVKAEPSAAARFVAGSLAFQPIVGDDNTPRVLRFRLENPGLFTASVHSRLEVEWQPDPKDEAWIDVPTDPRRPEVVFSTTSPATTFVSADRSQQTVAIPVGSGATPGSATVSWSLLLTARGNYRVSLFAEQVGSQGPPVVSTLLRASTLLSAEAPFSDDFLSASSDGIVEGSEGSPWREWTVEPVRDTEPPQCSDPEAVALPCPQTIWELGNREPDTRADESSTDPFTDEGRRKVGDQCDGKANVTVTGQKSCTYDPDHKPAAGAVCATGNDASDRARAANPGVGTTVANQNKTACASATGLNQTIDTYRLTAYSLGPKSVLCFSWTSPYCAAWQAYQSPAPGASGTSHEGNSTRPTNYVLLGRPMLTGPGALAPDQQFTRLRVDYQYTFQDLYPGIQGPATISLDAFLHQDSAVHEPTPDAYGDQSAATQNHIELFDQLSWGDPHIMRYLDGQWVNGSDEVRPTDGRAFTAEQLAQVALVFRLPLPGNSTNYDAQTDTTRQSSYDCPRRTDDPNPSAVKCAHAGCPGRADSEYVPHYCPTWRVAHAGLSGLDAADGIWKPLARFSGADETIGSWTSFADVGTNKAVTCARATLPQGEEIECMGFRKRVLHEEPLVPQETHIQHFDGLAGIGADGFWSNMEPDPFGNLNYRGGQHTRLLSPALRVPVGDAGAGSTPRLEYSQLHKFANAAGAPNPTGAGASTNYDGVTLFVRKLRDDGQGLHPTTPFLPVYPVTSASLPAIDSSKSISYNGRSAGSGLIGDTAPQLSPSLDLTKLYVFDYTTWKPDLATKAFDTVDTSVSGRFLNPPTYAKVLTSWDLSNTLVQFAFQVDTRGEEEVGPCATIGSNGECDQLGWLVDKFRITQASRQAYDLQVKAAKLASVGYNWTTLALGPGTDAIVNVTVFNKGMFQVKAGHVDVVLRGRDGSETMFRKQLQAFSAKFNETRTLSVPIEVPAQQQDYAIFVRFGIDEVPLRDDQDPATYLDDDPTDNCAVLTAAGGSIPQPCTVLDTPGIGDTTIAVRAIEDLRVQLTVDPVAGRVGFVRYLDITVENRGNVVVKDAKITFARQNLASAGDQESKQWTLLASPPPGPAVSWQALALDKPVDGGLRLTQTARYMLTATITKPQPDGVPPLASVDSVLAASYDTFYSDDFGGGLDSQHPATVSGTLQASDDWSLEPTLNAHLALGCCAWHFGSLANGTYPANADATLLFPSVDLSTASKAVFSFAHRDALEDGYDGARLEASTDGGASWIPLNPFGDDCPAGFVVLLTGGNPLCAIPQVGGFCPAGSVTGAVPTTVAGQAVCAIAGRPGPCPSNPANLVHVTVGGILVCAAVKLGACPSNSNSFTGEAMVCIRRASTCASSETMVVVSSQSSCAPTPAPGRCPPGTVGLTAQSRLCLTPAGHGGLLQAGTALSGTDPAQRDPAALTPAFTGDSRKTAQAQKGWRISEYDLAQVPGFTLPVDLIRLGQDGFPTYESKHEAGRDDTPRTTLAEWCAPGTSPTDGSEAETCWQRDNLRFDGPPSDPQAIFDGEDRTPGHTMWWSGTSDRNRDLATTAATAKTPTTTLDLAIPPIQTCSVEDNEDDSVRCLGQDDRYRLVFWLASSLTLGAGETACRERLRLTTASGAQLTTQVLATLPSGWVQHALTVQFANRDEPTQGTSPSLGAIRKVLLNYTDPNDTWSSGSSGTKTTLCNRPQMGVALDNVRVEVVRTDSSRRERVLDDARAPVTLPPGANLPDGSAAWNVGNWPSNPGHIVRWKEVTRVPVVPDAWQPYEVEANHFGDPATVWLFGDPQARRYPTNARERLMTPAISLREVGGTTATMTFWERFDTDIINGTGALGDGGKRDGRYPQFRDFRTVRVQAIEPTADGTEAWGPWTSLGTSTNLLLAVPKSTTPNLLCPDPGVNHDWCQVTVDVSSFVGKKVRFAFEMETGRNATISLGKRNPAVDAELGLFWMIDDVGIAASTLTGGPLQLRLHVGTDGSLGEGGLSVDNPQLVGFQYGRNVAIVPDAKSTLFAAPGQTVHVDGAVRNLAEGLEKDLVLQVRAVPLEGPCEAGSIDPVAATRSPLAGAAVGTTGVGRTVPFTLTPAGTVTNSGQANDRVRFAFDLPVPAGDCADFAQRIELRLLQSTPAGLTTFADENVGDHTRDLMLVVDDEPDLEIPPFGLRVSPMTVPAGPDGSFVPITIEVPVQNTGTVPLEALFVGVVPTRTPLDGALPVELDLVDLEVGPDDLPALGGAPSTFRVDWQPTASGFYRFDAFVTGGFASGPFPLEARTVGYALVGRDPLYWSDDLENGADGWVAEHAPSASMSRCNTGLPPSSNPAPPANAPDELGWHLVTDRAYDGEHAFFVGTPDPANQPYPTLRDELLTTPLVDLSFLADVGSNPNNPFVPDLTFRYMPILGDPNMAPNNGVVVQGVAVSPDGLTRTVGPKGLASAAYDGSVKCAGPSNSNPLVNVDPAATVKSVNAITGEAVGVWRAASVRQTSILDPATYTNANSVSIPLAGNQAQDILRFGTGDAQATGFYVDSVAMSAYRSSLLPAQHDAVLTTGADKTFNFQVQNGGVARDTFMAAIDRSRTQPAAFLEGGPAGQALIPVEVLTPALTLDAGASGVVAVRVRVPNDAGLAPISAGSIVLSVASASDPNQVSTGVIQVTRLETTDLPHLEVELRRPGTDSDTVDEQEPVSFLAVVRNDGRAPSRATDLVVLACPGDATAPLGQDLAACLDARKAGDEGSPHWPTVLKRADIPALMSPLDVPADQLARTVLTRTVSWVPPIGHTGLVHIVAVADGQGLMRQYEPRSVGLLDLHIEPLRRPDLVVTDLHVQDSRGLDVVEGFDGDQLRVFGTVTNAGTASAHDVEATLKAQHDLLVEPIGTLRPGESRTLSTTWVATAGNHVVGLTAHTTTPLDDLGNNALRISVGIRQGGLEITLDPPALTLPAAGIADLVVLVANRRDGPATVSFPVTLPEGVTLRGLPSTLALPRGGVEQLLATLTVSPMAERGTGVVRIGLRDEVGTDLAEAELPLAIASEQRVKAAADPVVTPPGRIVVPVRLRNEGDAAELALNATAPSGWKAELPFTQLGLGPGQAKELALRVTVPPDTAPGEHTLLLRSNGIDLGTFTVQVTAAPAWRSSLGTVRQLGDAAEAHATVTNIGNVAATPAFGGDLSRLQIDPAPALLGPGETAVYRIMASATDALLANGALVLPGGGAAVGLEANAAHSQVELVRWELLPARGLVAGDTVAVQAILRNNGDVGLQGVPVKVYTDGRLVATTDVDVPLGGEATAIASWRPTAGTHVVTLTVANGDEQSAQSELLPVRPAERGIPGPGLTAMLGAIALALAATLRRRP